MTQVGTGRGTALLRFAHELSWETLPAGTRGQAVRCLIDNLACGMFGAQFPWGKAVTDFAVSEGSTGGATIFGHATPVAPARAALCNGTMIHGFELDDIILGSLSHPGTVVVPAALAYAEHHRAPASRMLLGIVAGYEVMARLGAALGPRCNTAGFHTTGIAGAVASAVACAVIARLPFEALLAAVGIACSSGSGIKAFAQGTGGMVKRFHGGKGAEAGVVACELAARGFDGPLEALDGRFGLIEVVGGESADAALLDHRLGEDLAIARTWIKTYSCCGVIHTSLQALETIKQREGLAPDAIRAVRIGVPARVVEQNGNPNPTEPMNAQYSLPFCAAVALTGNVKDPGAFKPERLGEPRVRGMIPRIALHVDAEVEAAYPGRFGARVAVETATATHTQLLWYAHGMAQDPCSEHEVIEKFRLLTAETVAAAPAARLLEAIHRLASEESLADLGAALRAAAEVPPPSGVAAA